jgi:hypothetical protein
MSVAADPMAPAAAPRRRARFAVRGLRSMGFGAFIGVALHLAFGLPLWSGVVHSVSIATMCWFCIDTSRIGAASVLHRHDPASASESRSRWPGWPWMLPIIVVGTVIGFSVGNEIAGWITGHRSPGYLRGSLSQALSMLTLSLVPGVVITYWFYSREVIAGQQAAMLTAQRQAAEHQLKLLESQLEPHMLFNTLANLRVLIGIDPPRAQAMLDQLIGFLRATLSGSRAALHPLSAEFARLADYLALMQVRMGGRLEHHFDLPADLAVTPVPPLLLQPLVENCIKHGLEPEVAGGRIDVSAARDGAQLVLTVRDTGAGLSDTQSDGTRFGLVQVRERLATLYGTAASLELRAADGAEGGTVAIVRLPVAPHSKDSTT